MVRVEGVGRRACILNALKHWQRQCQPARPCLPPAAEELVVGSSRHPSSLPGEIKSLIKLKAWCLLPLGGGETCAAEGPLQWEVRKRPFPAMPYLGSLV